MLPEIVGWDAVEHGAARGRQHGGQELHDERRLKIDEAVCGEQARYHVGVLRRALRCECRQRAGRQSEIEADREHMARAHARPDADQLGVGLLVRHDLVEQRHQRGVAAIHDREASDLDHVEARQDRAHRRLGALDQRLVDQRLAHQARDQVLGASGEIVHAASPPSAL
jgi:hypothetical protein